MPLPAGQHQRFRLNIAELKLSVLGRQCLDRSIRDQAEVAAWTARRKATAVTVDWHFTTANARVKLKRLSPALHA